ncbi:hypothetical protein HFK89_03700 [Ralstonia pseudosolanacearum]|uniref:hypothetical protein n=1 Tax=Ralstonia pseudosolanacearum TaxID=1310165 RepID=UPI0011144289|nr:hypothetical protein [Ralstonia pseudosolanacearum]MCK4161570.1 hypothetical protein [Ralstonia pseudosolanacearum]
MARKERFSVGQIKTIIAKLDAEFPPLTPEEIQANKVSEKRRAADRKKREDVAILCSEAQTLKDRGMTLQQIAEVLRGEGTGDAMPAPRRHLLNMQR